MSERFEMRIECLDREALRTVSSIDFPFRDCVTWSVNQVDVTSPRESATVTFVLAAGSAVEVASRVMRHRYTDNFALGACVGSDVDPAHKADGITRLDANGWREDVRVLLVSLAAVVGEGQPEVFACIDWSDVLEALDVPGEVIFECSMKPNAKALDEVRGRLATRLAGRQCRSVLCMTSGGPYLRYRELQEGLVALRLLGSDDAVVRVCDRLAPFAGKPGCCIFAIPDERDTGDLA